MKKQLFVKLVGIFAILFLLFNNGAKMNVFAQPYDIKSIERTPDYVTPETTLNISIEFFDTSGIEYVRLFFCQLSPEFICDPKPILMDQEGSKFTATYLVTQEAGSTIGYHFVIYYTNDTEVMLPDSVDFLDLEIVQPTPDSYYIKIDVNEPTTEKTTVYLILPAISLFVISVLQTKRKRQ